MMKTEIRKTKKDKNKRRFSDEQIKSLETLFESESKLEPMKKLELARDLGLHPRQVAIWFQNKRARWKSKQLERDYSILRDNYDALASRFESLKKEKQSLQVQKLSQPLEKHQEVGSRFDLAGNRTEGDSNNGDARCEDEGKSSHQVEEARSTMLSRPDDKNIKFPGCCGEEEPKLNIVGTSDDSLTSPENWCGFDAGDIFFQSSTESQWLDFWT